MEVSLVFGEHFKHTEHFICLLHCLQNTFWDCVDPSICGRNEPSIQSILHRIGQGNWKCELFVVNEPEWKFEKSFRSYEELNVMTTSMCMFKCSRMQKCFPPPPKIKYRHVVHGAHIASYSGHIVNTISLRVAATRTFILCVCENHLLHPMFRLQICSYC